MTAGLEGLEVPLRVAVMGCVVNGPGEAREADLGVASGNGKGQIFVRGEVIKTVKESRDRRDPDRGGDAARRRDAGPEAAARLTGRASPRTVSLTVTAHRAAVVAPPAAASDRSGCSAGTTCRRRVALLPGDPVENVFVASRVRSAGLEQSESRLPDLGLRAGRRRCARSATPASNLVPVNADDGRDRAWTEFAGPAADVLLDHRAVGGGARRSGGGSANRWGTALDARSATCDPGSR